MRMSQDPTVRMMYALFRERNLFREAVVIRPEKFVRAERGNGKQTAALGATPAEMRRIIANPRYKEKNQEGLEAFESDIARVAGLPENSVLVTPVHGTERFEAEDIFIYEGAGKKLASLKARYPAHFKNIEEVAQTYLAFRVCTTQEYRKRLSEPKIAKKVFAMITEK
jgi:hypothetical protein